MEPHKCKFCSIDSEDDERVKRRNARITKRTYLDESSWSPEIIGYTKRKIRCESLYTQRMDERENDNNSNRKDDRLSKRVYSDVPPLSFGDKFRYDGRMLQGKGPKTLTEFTDDKIESDEHVSRGSDRTVQRTQSDVVSLSLSGDQESSDRLGADFSSNSQSDDSDENGNRLPNHISERVYRSKNGPNVTFDESSIQKMERNENEREVDLESPPPCQNFDFNTKERKTKRKDVMGYIIGDRERTKRKYEERERCKREIYDEGCNVIHIEKTPYLIRQPGNYVLDRNIKHTDACDAIIIDADSVTLNLHDRTITGKGIKRLDSMAVRVKTKHRSIKIINGILENFAPHALIVEPDCDKIEIEDLYFRSNGIPDRKCSPMMSGAFLIEDCRSVSFRRINAIDNFTTGGALRDINGLNVLDSIFRNQLGKNIAIGLYLTGHRTLNVKISGCSFNVNKGGEYTSGLKLDALVDKEVAYSSVEIDNCQINGNFALCNTARSSQGMSIGNVNGLVLRSIEAFHNQNMATKSNRCGLSICSGIAITNCKNINMEDCNVDGTKGGFTNTVGIRISKCNHITINDCRTLNTIGEHNASVYGWVFDRVSECVIRDSITEGTVGGSGSVDWYFRSPEHVLVNKTTAISGIRGYFVDGYSRGITFEGNYADDHEYAAFSAKEKNDVDVYIKNVSIRGHPNFDLHTLPRSILVQEWLSNRPPKPEKDMRLENLSIITGSQKK